MMGKAIYVEFDGARHSVELADGVSLMEGAVSNGIRGIDGDCGGSRACATCHVHVDAAWLEKVGPPTTEQEAEMLELAAESAADSRLACQITMSPELDGVVVHLPESQH